MKALRQFDQEDIIDPLIEFLQLATVRTWKRLLDREKQPKVKIKAKEKQMDTAIKVKKEKEKVSYLDRKI